MTRHFDADGNLTGWTETESPWDDLARAEAEALLDAEAYLICSECGNLREFCSRPDALGESYPARRICYVTMSRGAADRRYSDKHEERPYHDGRFGHWTEKPTAGTPFHFRDGVHVTSLRADVGDDFL